MGTRTDPQKVAVKQLKMPWTVAVTNENFVRQGSGSMRMRDTDSREALLRALGRQDRQRRVRVASNSSHLYFAGSMDLNRVPCT